MSEPIGSAADHPLDNPAYASLTGAHAHFAVRHGGALRYHPEVAPFLAVPSEPSPADWADLARLVGAGAVIPLAGVRAPAPQGWEVVRTIAGVQLIDVSVAAAPDPELITLGARDMPEMLELVARTEPGPFRPRTVELGNYLGVRRGGELIAMAGERLHPPGWTEISAVCTDARFRGEGLGTRLVHAVAHGIRERGERPFLHAAASNTAAIRLYQRLGFQLRREVSFSALRVPADAAA